jgi:hypothetical protein
MIFRTLAITLIRTGVPFGIAMALVFSWLLGRSWGVMIGVTSGVLFGVAMTLFVFLMSERTRIQGDFENEAVLWQGPASHIVPQPAKARAVWMAGTPTQTRGGWLVLTPTRLAFRAHGRNLLNQKVDIDRREIRSTESGRSLGLFPNILRISLVSRTAETFVVRDLNEWIRQLVRPTAAN